MNDFQFLKNNPDEALDKLANNIYDITIGRDKNKNNDISIWRLQSTLYEFLKTSISKLVWSSQDKEWSWTLVKSISDKLMQLKRDQIISAKQLDSLLWQLIYRYCYFLELEGEKLSPEFYNRARNDIMNEEVPLWSYIERNTYGIKKAHYLKQALMEAEIFAQAYAAGLVAHVRNS